MKDLAPIGVITYSRLTHLKKTVESLANNTLAKYSDLFIFSDAAKLGDETKVSLVRKYIKQIQGFNNITIVEREVNGRTENSRNGIKYLLDNYGKMIWMEDDIVTAPGFLQFINDALKFYKDDERVLSIGGHTPNLKTLKILSKDFYVVQRYCPWGSGIWKRKYELIRPLPKWEIIKKDGQLKKQLNTFGNDLWRMIKMESQGYFDAFDLKACYTLAVNNLYTILPTQSLVKNIGLDGSGLHCGHYDPYKGDKLSTKTNFAFSKELSLTKDIIKEYKEFYNIASILSRIIKIVSN